MNVNKEAWRYWLNIWGPRVGMNYNKLAQALGFSPGYVHHWFHGGHGVGDMTAVKVMVYFHAKKAFPEWGEVLKALADMGLDRTQVKELINSQVKPTENEKAFLKALEAWKAPLWVPIGLQKLADVSVARPELFNQSKTQLLGETPVVALWGMGGIGKTSLLHQVLQDKEVQRAFWSGGLWAELGPTTRLETWVQRWCLALGLQFKVSEDVISLVLKVLDYVSKPGKCFLVVIDDVWDLGHLDILRPLKEAPGIGFLITTRDRQIATAVNPDPIEVPPMREGEALELLRREIAEPQMDSEQIEHGEELVALLNGIPLAISLLGKQIKLRKWTNVLSWIRNERIRLSMLVSSYRPDRYTSVRIMLDLSYESLSAELKQRFRQLGVFSYGSDFTILPLIDLWGLDISGMELSEALLIEGKTLFMLFDLGLLELTYQDARAPRFRLHTVVHDYVRIALRQADEEEACRVRYIQVYEQLAHSWMQDFDHFRWQIEPEWSNIEQALRYTCESGYYEDAAFLLNEVCRFLLVVGKFRTLNEWITLLEAHWPKLSGRAQGWVDHARFQLLDALQRWEEARKYQERLLSNPEIDARTRDAVYQVELGSALQQGDMETASYAYEQVRDYASSEDPIRRYALLKAEALELQRVGEYELALATLDQAMELALTVGRPTDLGEFLLMKADAFTELGNILETENCLNNALEIARTQGLATVEWTGLLGLTTLYLALRRFDALPSLETRLRELLGQMELPPEEAAAHRAHLDHLFINTAHFGRDKA